jgi:hypothetical protein
MEKRLENLVRTKQYNDLAATDKRYADQFVEDADGFDVLKKMAQANIGVASTSKTNAMRKKELDAKFEQQFGTTNSKIWRKNTSLYLQPLIWGAAACLVLILVRTTLFQPPSIAENVQKKIETKENTHETKDKTLPNINAEELKTNTSAASEVKSVQIASNAKPKKVQPTLESAPTLVDVNQVDRIVEDQNSLSSAIVAPSVAASASPENLNYFGYALDDVKTSDEVAAKDRSDDKISKKSNAEDLGLVSSSKKKMNTIKRTKRLTKVNVNDGLYYLEVAY